MSNGDGRAQPPTARTGLGAFQLVSLWATAALALLIFFFLWGVAIGWIPEQASICEYNQYTGKEDCPRYDIATWVLIEASRFINDASPAITAVATGVIAWFTITLSRTSRDQHNRLKETVDQAQKHFAASNRPWIPDRVTPCTDLEYRRGIIRLSVLFELANTGQYPAQRVFPRAALIPTERLLERGTANLPQLDRPLRAPGYTLFPGEPPSSFRVMAAMRDEELAPYQTEATRLPILLSVVVAIHYEGFDGQQHVTMATYAMFRADRSAVTIANPVDCPMPVQLIRDFSYPMRAT